MATTRTALVVRGGWPGHSPVEATDGLLPYLASQGYDTLLSDSLECYADPELMARVDLVVQCWTMGTLSPAQLSGLSGAVAAGTGLAGWHGGIVDAFRDSPGYLQLVGGQFAYHPDAYVDHTIDMVGEHPIVAGLGSVALRAEQYWVLTDAACDVLATTTLAATQDTPWREPVTCPAVWTRSWGAGRVFVCTPGHTPDDLAVPGIRTLIERGMTWASR